MTLLEIHVAFDFEFVIVLVCFAQLLPIAGALIDVLAYPLSSCLLTSLKPIFSLVHGGWTLCGAAMAGRKVLMIAKDRLRVMSLWLVLEGNLRMVDLSNMLF